MGIVEGIEHLGAAELPRPLSIKIRRTLLVTCNVALSNFGFWYKTKTQTSLTTLVKYDQKWALVTHLNKVAI